MVTLAVENIDPLAACLGRGYLLLSQKKKVESGDIQMSQKKILWSLSLMLMSMVKR